MSRYERAANEIPMFLQLKEVVRRRGSRNVIEEALLRGTGFIFDRLPDLLPEERAFTLAPGQRLPFHECVFEVSFVNDQDLERLFVLVAAAGLTEDGEYAVQVGGFCDEPKPEQRNYGRLTMYPIPVSCQLVGDQEPTWGCLEGFREIPDPDADLPPNWTEQDCWDEATRNLGLALRCLAAIESPTVRMERKAIPASKRSLSKRIPKGGWEYRIVTLGKPATEKRDPESQRGTHATPRQHDRRGHVRRLKSGKVVSVRQCVVPKAVEPGSGVIVHDYRIIGANKEGGDHAGS